MENGLVRVAPDKIVSMDRQTDMKIAYAQLHIRKHYVQISEQYLQKCRSNALDNNDLVKFISSRGDNSATNVSMVMKIAQAEPYTTSDIVSLSSVHAILLDYFSAILLGLFLWTTIIQ